MSYLDAKARRSLEQLKDDAVSLFSKSDWHALGIETDCSDIIDHHPRLLRSKAFGDADYPDCVFEVLIQIAKRDVENLAYVRQRIEKARAAEGSNVSSLPKPSQTVIVFSPTVFTVPESPANQNLLAVMMPFDAAMAPVSTAIQKSAQANGLECKRGDDIWNSSVVVQDIFELIYKAFIVVCDFSGRNPNVFYEAGIAHTLGKHVIPITQNNDDVPFNLRHHRYIHYLNNAEGLSALTAKLEERVGGLLEQRKKDQWW
jgi:hypothetical protein